ncbi:MAG: hypothetical protein ACFB2W_28290 [Leptolyngbyaceae cyanobacterium]
MVKHPADTDGFSQVATISTKSGLQIRRCAIAVIGEGLYAEQLQSE